jgi:hypothetical protein
LYERINATAAENWNWERGEPFGFDYDPYEQISVLHMISDTDNDFFERVMKVFVDLVLEAEEVIKTV